MYPYPYLPAECILTDIDQAIRLYLVKLISYDIGIQYTIVHRGYITIVTALILLNEYDRI